MSKNNPIFEATLRHITSDLADVKATLRHVTSDLADVKAKQ
jgi:hypothetical protein